MGPASPCCWAASSPRPWLPLYRSAPRPSPLPPWAAVITWRLTRAGAVLDLLKAVTRCLHGACVFADCLAHHAMRRASAKIEQRLLMWSGHPKNAAQMTVDHMYRRVLVKQHLQLLTGPARHPSACGPLTWPPPQPRRSLTWPPPLVAVRCVGAQQETRVPSLPVP